MGKKLANFFDIQCVGKFSFYKKQHVLDLFYNTSFQKGPMRAINQTINHEN